MNRQVSTVSVVLLVWALLGAATCQANEEDEAGSLVKVFVRRGPVLIGELKEETPDSLKLLNLTTGEELTIARASVAALRRNVSHEEAIKRVGLVPYLAWRVKRAKGLALRGEVVEVTRTSVYVNLGERHGVQLAAQLNVYRDGEEVKDPQTGEVLGKLCALVGKAEVIGVAQKSSEVKLRGDGPAELQPGDVVELAGRGTTVAILPIIAAEEAARQSAERIRADWTRALVARGVWVLEPADVDRAINELGLARGETLRPAVAIRIGKALGACAVVTGSVRPGPRGHPGMVYPHLISVSTGRRLSARPQPLPRPGWIELLGLVDPDRDVVAGTWKLEQEGFACDDTASARISFPYQPPEEYDFLVEFTVTDAGACTAQLVSKGTVPFTWSMNAGSPRRCRIEDIDGHSVIGNPTLRKRTFELGRRYVSVVCVRDDGVTCLVNGQVTAEHKTDYSDLSRNTKWRMPERLRLRLGVGAWHGPTTFHRAAVRPLSGTGVFIRANAG